MTEVALLEEQPKPQRHPLADCATCPLNDPKNAFVPTKHANGQTKLVVVGEAPGTQEAKRGVPFTGPSGRLLDMVLKHHGYTRDEVLLTNVTLCRPQDNATPPKAAVAACRTRLLADIANSGCRDVVALGGTATSALIDDPRGITQLRVGPPKLPTRGLDGTGIKRVVATWHPAYCLRNADAFPSLVSDIGKLKNEVANVWSPPEWRYFDDVDTARAVIAELQRRTSHLVVDIEVGIEKDISFGHPNEYDLLCVGIAYERGKAVVLGTNALTDPDVRDDLRDLFRNKKLIGHNGKFDLAGLWPTLGALELWFDTMLAHYALDERPGTHGLKTLAVELLGAPQYDLEIKPYLSKSTNYANIPREILYKYNAYDVACTWDLFEMFVPLLEEEVKDWPYPEIPVKTLRDVHDHMIRGSNELMFTELNGIPIDVPYLRELRQIFYGRLAALGDKMDEAISEGTYEGVVEGEVATEAVHKWIRHINPNSPKQVKEYLHSRGINVESTDKETLKRLQSLMYDKGYSETYEYQFVSTLLENRRQAKLFGTYVEGIRKRMHQGRVHTTYMLHGTTSGRLASRNPNLQNVVRDKEIRRMFVPSKPDHVFIQRDYKQAEGRVIATLSQDDYLTEVFNDLGVDIFDNLSDQLYGEGNWAKEERIRTKAFFYGIGYGREPYSIGLEYNMSPSEATRRYNEFMDLIPNVAAWQRSIRQTVLSGRDLITPFGRRRRFMLITDENRKAVLNEALSFVPQSTASDICLSAAATLRPMLKGIAHLRLTIHDALVTECHRSRVDEVSEMMRVVMEDKGREFTSDVPFVTDATVGTHWGEL